VIRIKNWMPSLILCGVLCLVFSLLPLGTALEVGGDEGYELAKGFLCAKGFPLYSQIWSDQPPGLSLILGAILHMFPGSILAVRIIAVGFAIVLFTAFFEIIRHISGIWTASIAIFLLMSAPGVILLSVSVMQEIPAFAIFLLSFALLQKWQRTNKLFWLVVSSAVMGIALTIKLTPAIALPAVFLHLMFGIQTSSKTFKQRLVAAFLWFVGGCLLFTLISLSFHHSILQQNWNSQFGTHPGPHQEMPTDFPFQFSHLQNHYETLLAAAGGVLLLFRKKMFRQHLFPCVFLITAISIHLFHVPWWNYYYLHLAIPLAWLAAISINEALLLLTLNLSNPNNHWLNKKTLLTLIITALAAVVVARNQGRLVNGFKLISHSEKIEDSNALKTIKQHAHQARWIYTDQEVYAFHAQIPLIPELAVVTLKRYWSGQITENYIIQTCQKYRPEFILFNTTPTLPEWTNYLSNDYILILQETNHSLFQAKTSAEIPSEK
jgi:hypothetical protein